MRGAGGCLSDGAILCQEDGLSRLVHILDQTEPSTFAAGDQMRDGMVPRWSQSDAESGMRPPNVP